MKTFNKIATEATTLCDLMEGRDKIETEDLIKDYPKGVTIEDFTYMETGENSCWVYTIADNDKVFAFAGVSLKSIFEAALKEFEGDYEELRKQYAIAVHHNDAIKVKLEYGKTRSGQRFTKATVV